MICGGSEKMRIIHIASFKGNIGDVFNHEGFYSLFGNLFEESEVKRVEIRDFYYNSSAQLKFDKSYAKEVNKYDLCIIGGGGFFDAYWERSLTGVTLDISDDFINDVTIPVWINAIGYHELPGTTNDFICCKFRDFILKISAKKNWFLSVRKDGSYTRIINRYDKEFAALFYNSFDNAFYNIIEFGDRTRFSKTNRRVIGINITNDLFSDDYNHGITSDQFNVLIVRFIKDISTQYDEIVLLPHTPQDVILIGKILSLLPQEIVRNRIITSPFFANSEDGLSIYHKWYEKCDIIIGMRFHSCIMALVWGIPVIGLASHNQIEALFAEMNMQDYCVVINSANVADRLLDKIVNYSEESYAYHRDIIIDDVKKWSQSYRKVICGFLERNGVEIK